MWWQRRAPHLLLQVLSPIYQALNDHNLKRRESRQSRVDVPLISIGNITVGGSGKTPFVLWLADALRAQGNKPVILCRGDGGNARQAVHITPEHSAAEIGDEALLLARESGCPVVSAQDRVAGARMSATLGDIIILDDGFQYRQLHRDCDIVLLPAGGLGNGALLPAGPLREPLSALQRADIIVQSGSRSELEIHADFVDIKKKTWSWHALPSQLLDWNLLSRIPPATVHAVCGIAKPERFIYSLQDIGIDVGQHSFFPDHHRYTAHDMQRILESSQLTPVFTAKDAVKVQTLWPQDKPLWVLKQIFGAESGLLHQIESTLNTDGDLKC